MAVAISLHSDTWKKHTGSWLKKKFLSDQQQIILSETIPSLPHIPQAQTIKTKGSAGWKYDPAFLPYLKIWASPDYLAAEWTVPRAALICWQTHSPFITEELGARMAKLPSPVTDEGSFLEAIYKHVKVLLTQLNTGLFGILSQAFERVHMSPYFFAPKIMRLLEGFWKVEVFTKPD